jgi:hypothetical protein
MTYRHPNIIEQVMVETRVLGPTRTVRDLIYFGWCSAWLSLPLGPLWALTNVPFVAGCRGYFEWRDGIEFPALSRFYSIRWHRWRKAFVADRGWQ